MKIRILEDLVNFIGDQKQIRKRELTSLRLDLNGPNHLDRVTRTAIVFSYAHWEGFVKNASRAYLHLVTHKSRSLDSLSLNIQAIACRQQLLIAAGATKRIGPHISVAKRFTDEFYLSCVIDAEKAIDTESNLNAEVFENICICVGVDYTKWSSRGPFIDDMFKCRCDIAHGELFTPQASYAIEVLEFTIKAIDDFATDIENGAVLENYLRLGGAP